MACHIEEGYEQRGVPESEAERRAWATVNKETHGGKKSGSGRGKAEDHSPARKGGRLGGQGRCQQTGGCTFGGGQEGRADTKEACCLAARVPSRTVSNQIRKQLDSVVSPKSKLTRPIRKPKATWWSQSSTPTLNTGTSRRMACCGRFRSKA